MRVCVAHLRVGRHELGHLLSKRVRRGLVAAAGGEGHAAHGEGEGLAGEVGEDAVEGVLDVGQGALFFGVKSTRREEGEESKEKTSQERLHEFSWPRS